MEERLSVLYSEGVAKGRISAECFVACTAANPARLFGLYPRKGTLFPGSDADVVILDPKAEHTLHADRLHGPSDFSLYDGMRLRGRIDSVFLRGNKVAENGVFNGKRGVGTLLHPDSGNTRR